MNKSEKEVWKTSVEVWRVNKDSVEVWKVRRESVEVWRVKRACDECPGAAK